MPQFLCSYAHDIPCYADFVVEAPNERAAWRLIRKALREQKFDDVSAEPWWENSPQNERVFVMQETDPNSGIITLAQLIGEASQQPTQ